MAVAVLRRHHEGRLLHRRARECRGLVGLAHARLGIHALDRHYASKRRVGGWLRQVGLAGLGPGVVGDQVEVLAVGGRDAEGLLHQAVCLVAVPLGLAVVLVLVATAARVGRLAGGAPSRAEASASLAFHLAVRQEAARHAAGAPRLAVRPPPHAGLALIPHEDGARADRLPLLLRQAPLHSGQQAQATGLEKLDGVAGGPHVAVVRLHLVRG